MRIKRTGWMAAVLTGALLAAPALSRAEDAKKEERPRTHQPAGGSAPTLREQIDKLAEDLKLTDEQKEKVTEILKARSVKAREIREDSSLSDQERREKLREVFQEHDKKMKEILTTEQFEKWQKMRAQGRGPGGPGGPPRRPRPGAEEKN
ncbi:MAG: hypothetical protein N3I86_09560 [Verrucomicrobiae bacterium]|nr:hypothetical protein [Verrucomicrobiae bacterium]MDW8307776.1 hypothetical protein [Verrucomicrobiales bacterium]